MLAITTALSILALMTSSSRITALVLTAAVVGVVQLGLKVQSASVTLVTLCKTRFARNPQLMTLVRRSHVMAMASVLLSRAKPQCVFVAQDITPTVPLVLKMKCHARLVQVSPVVVMALAL